MSGDGDQIALLLRKAAFYRQLAEKMMDKRGAEEAVRWALDLESEATALRRRVSKYPTS